MASKLIEEVVGQIKQDIEENALIALNDLLRYIPEWKLKEFLKEANIS